MQMSANLRNPNLDKLATMKLFLWMLNNAICDPWRQWTPPAPAPAAGGGGTDDAGGRPPDIAEKNAAGPAPDTPATRA